jgi:hypothetical protein
MRTNSNFIQDSRSAENKQPTKTTDHCDTAGRDKGANVSVPATASGCFFTMRFAFVYLVLSFCPPLQCIPRIVNPGQANVNMAARQVMRMYNVRFGIQTQTQASLGAAD